MLSAIETDIIDYLAEGLNMSDAMDAARVPNTLRVALEDNEEFQAEAARVKAFLKQEYLLTLKKVIDQQSKKGDHRAVVWALEYLEGKGSALRATGNIQIDLGEKNE